jgi:transcriptional regulator with XRE-family HTH domain
MDLCAEIAAARRESGISQHELATRLMVTREKVARLEGGVGSVDLVLRVMSVVQVRVQNLARGSTICEQIKNARIKKGWSVADAARKAGIDVRTVVAIEAGAGTVAPLTMLISALAPHAKRQRASPAIWHYNRSEQSRNDSRFTPPDFLEVVDRAFGVIGLDPCNHPSAPINAARKISLPQCGLTESWQTEGLVFVNPPFSHLSRWLKKANDAWDDKIVEKMLFLLPASRLDISEYVGRTANIASTLILSKRLRFVSLDDPSGKYRAPFPLALTCWGCSSSEIATFRSHWPALLLPPQRAV